MSHGSKPLKPDPRYKRFTKHYGAPVLPSFPKTLNTPRKRVKNQGSAPSCTKQTTELAAEYQDGIEMSAEWAWDRLCGQLGNLHLDGADPQQAMSLNVKLGSMPATDPDGPEKRSEERRVG